MKSKLQMLMVAGVATGAFALGSQAQAAFAGFDAADFYVIEAPGQYTLVNNSDDWYIYAFGVSNTLAGDGYTARTGQTDWDAYSCIGSCVGNLSAFEYYNSDGSGSAGLGTDVGPNSSSSKFYFSAPPESTYQIDITNGTNSETVSGPAVSPGVPEPASWALMILGFGAMGAMLRRRRSSPARA